MEGAHNSETHKVKEDFLNEGNSKLIPNDEWKEKIGTKVFELDKQHIRSGDKKNHIVPWKTNILSYGMGGAQIMR